jgi:hypothetical protein
MPPARNDGVGNVTLVLVKLFAGIFGNTYALVADAGAAGWGGVQRHLQPVQPLPAHGRTCLGPHALEHLGKTSTPVSLECVD